MIKGKVAIVKVTPETVLDDIARAMELAEFKSALSPDAPTILKDNISWHLFFPSANTTPWQLEGVLRVLKGAGFGPLIACHNRTVVTDSPRGQRLNHLDVVWRCFGVREIYNYKPEQVKWVPYKPKRPTPALEMVYRGEIKVPEPFIGTNIIHLPTVKCHIYTTTTGAMKNAFGGLLNVERHYTHTHIHRTLVDLLIIQQEIHTGLFAVMDGTWAGNGPGPRTMKPVEKNLILASSDQVAIDAVAAKLMGFDPLSIGYIRMAHEEKLGVGDPREIELVGDRVEDWGWGFQVGDNMASLVGDLLWFGALKKIQWLFFHTPLVNLFIAGSYIYHDFIWYPLRAPQHLKAFYRSKWGDLFNRRYGPEGELASEVRGSHQGKSE